MRLVCLSVILAKAGVQAFGLPLWIPAFAGMTTGKDHKAIEKTNPIYHNQHSRLKLRYYCRNYHYRKMLGQRI